ncbi:MAG: anti-sigma factor family protein [Acidobacteriota bacterium]
MMRCQDVRPILSFFLEKETDPFETLQARRHLEGCAACRARADRLSTVMRACDAYRDGRPPADTASLVMARLRSLKATATARGRTSLAAKWTGLAALLTAGLAVLTGGPAADTLRGYTGPLRAIWEWLSVLGGADAVRSFLASAGPAVVRLIDGRLAADLAAGAGLDLTVSVRILATALAFGFLLAIPAAIVTAWLLYDRVAFMRPGAARSAREPRTTIRS